MTEPRHSPEEAVLRVTDVVRIPVEAIEISAVRIRKELGAVEELAYSLGTYGLLHPIQVYRSGGRYRLIAGERRLRAAMSLGWPLIDARIHGAGDHDLLLELVENTQRKHLNDAEEADALIHLVRAKGYEIKEVAAQVGRSEAYVSKRVRVFEDTVLRAQIEAGTLSVSVAEEFLIVPVSNRPSLVAQAVTERWDVARVRETLRDALAPKPVTGTAALRADTGQSQELLGPIEPNAVEGSFREIEAKDIIASPHVHGTAAGIDVERPSDLARQVRLLARTLRDLRPFQLTPADEKALADLLQVLLNLARAHAGPGRTGLVFPSIQDAERSARTHRRR